jgi:hypothetical protein
MNMLRSTLFLAPLLGAALVTGGMNSAGAAVVPSASAAVMQTGTLTHETVAFRGGRIFIPHGGFGGFHGGFNGGYHRWGNGAFYGGLGAGLLAGGLAGAYGYGYGYGPYYDYYPDTDYGYGYGYAAPPVVAAPVPGNSVGYCEQRYRSYDPSSGTYLGYDGQRHPC